MKKRQAVRVLFPQHYSLLLEGNNLMIFLNSLNVAQILSSQNNSTLPSVDEKGEETTSTPIQHPLPLLTSTPIVSTSTTLSTTGISTSEPSTITTNSPQSNSTVTINPIHQSHDNHSIHQQTELRNMIGESKQNSTTSQISESNDEISHLKNRIIALEKELKVKNKRFCCF